MTGWIEYLDSLFQSEFQSLLWVSAIASGATIVAMLIHRLVNNKVSVRLLSLLWLLVLIRFVLFVVPESPTSVLNLFPQLPAPVSEIPDAVHTKKFLPVVEFVRESDPAIMIAESEFTNEPTETPGMLSVTGAIKAVWLAGVIWLATLLLVRYVRLQAIIKRSACASPELQSLFDSCKQEFQFTRSVKLRITQDIESPATTGVFRSVILMPCWSASELSEQQQRLIFAHELIHLRKRDGIVQLVAFAVSTLHWFNPFVHIATRRIEACCELDCDQRVLNAYRHDSATQRLYGQTILQIAERSSSHWNLTPVLMGGFIGNDNKLIKQRIAMLFNTSQPRKLGAVIVFAFILVLVAVGFTTAQTTVPLSDQVKQDQTESDKVANVDPELPQENVIEKPAAKPKKVDEIQPLETDYVPKKAIGVRAGTNMVVNFNFNIAEIMVDDPTVIRCTPLTSSSLKLTGLKPGVASILISDTSRKQHHLAVYVTHQIENVDGRIDETNSFLKKRATEIAKTSRQPVLVASGEAYSLTSGQTHGFKSEFRIPEIRVADPEIIKVTPTSPNGFLVTAHKPGATQVAIKNEKNEKIEFQILVNCDTLKLNLDIKKHWPKAKVQADLMDFNQVILKGSVSDEEHRTAIFELARQHAPVVINQLQINGESNSIVYAVKVYEIPTAKLKSLGIQGSPGANQKAVTKFAELISKPGARISAATIKPFVKETSILKILAPLEKHNVATLTDQPVLVGKIGQPAEFLTGMEIPISTDQGVEFRTIGTKLNMNSFAMGTGKDRKLQVQLNLEYSQLAEESNVGDTPELRVRRINTGVATAPGETIAIVLDTKSSKSEEKEVVFLITPRFLPERLADHPELIEMQGIPGDVPSHR